MSDVDTIRATIKEIAELSAKYGKLVNDRTITYLEASAIIAYYEEDGESEALIAADAAVKESKARLSASQGASGGLTKRINALEDQLQEMSNIKRNNAQLARISSHAADLVEFCDKENNRLLDVNGESLNENPLYIRLRAEIGIEDA